MELQQAPGPKGTELLRTAARLSSKDLLQELLRAHREHGDLVHFGLPRTRVVLLNDPESIRHVLLENARNYTKGEKIEELRPVLGHGLLTSEGDFWLRHRRLAQPAFRHDRLAALGDTMADCVTAALDELEPLARQRRAFDLSEVLSALTLEIVGRSLFSVSLSSVAQEVAPALIEVLRHTSFRARALVKWPEFVPTPGQLRFRKATRTLKKIVLELVRARRQSGEDKADLLGMLLAARDDQGQGMSEEQLCDETMTLILAGHETTANALAWTFYLLSRAPQIEERILREADQVAGGAPPRGADLPKLRYARAVVQEGMRLYPPAWLISRSAVEDDEVLGYRIPARTLVLVSPYLLHRHPKHWDRPEEFDPERFSPEREKARARFSYLPFGGGPRICIGSELALMEAQLILSSFVQRFSLELVPGHPVEMEPVVTLRPREGIRVVPVRRREGAGAAA